ncbi:hypothetical protein D3C73_1660690 [compost metagenome]
MICIAPIPSEVATPKAVAITAKPLNKPDMRCTGRHGNDLVDSLISATPWRRYWKKAIASATML